MKYNNTAREAAFMNAITQPEMWKPQFSKIARKLDLPVSTVFDMYNRIKKVGKVELIIKELSDIELRNKVYEIQRD